MNAKQSETAQVWEINVPRVRRLAAAVGQNHTKMRPALAKLPVGFGLGVEMEETNLLGERKSGSPAEFVDQAAHVGEGHELAASGFFGDVPRIRFGVGDGLDASVSAVPVKINLVLANNALHRVKKLPLKKSRTDFFKGNVSVSRRGNKV